MKAFLIFVLIGLVATGCASVPAAGGSPDQATPTGLPAAAASATDTRGAESASRPLSVTANPPRLPIVPAETPFPSAPAGWQTYTSPALGVTVDFPADWTAAEGTSGVQFSSPQGATISLAGANAAQDDSASFQCTTLLMASGLTADACGDAASNRYHASFHWTAADGSARMAVLSTQDAAALEVYRSMLASLRLAH